MAKMRVYELANSLGIEVERALNLLRQVGATPRNHMSVVERVPARRVRQLLKQNKNAALPPSQIPDPEPVAHVDMPGATVRAAEPAEETKSVSPQHQEASTPSSVSGTKQSGKETVQPAGQEKATRSKATPAAEPPVQSEPNSVPAEAKAEQPAKEPAQGQRVESRPEPVAAAEPKRRQTEKQGPKVTSAETAKPAVVKSETQADDKQLAGQRTSSAAASASKSMGTAARGQTREAVAAEERKSAKSGAQRERVQSQPESRPAAESKPGPSRSAKGAPKGRSGQSAARSRRAAGRAVEQSTAGIQEQPAQRRTRKRPAAKGAKVEKPKAPTGPILIPESLTVNELAELLQVNATSIIMKLMEAGVMAAINQSIEFDVAAAVAEKLGYEVTRPKEEKVLRGEIDDPEESLVPRPPVVTIMGHVDHGKTTLLDTIRSAKVAQQEAGGITQHIGAYQVEFNGERITFLDTPGHEAFTSMRSRGAQVTDIAVLVVAADDGVMPQTIEAISHAKAADVPIIVAINKIDRPGANPDRIKQQLTEHGLVPEEWGGDTVCVEVSALKGEGIDELLEMILLVAELRELKANPERLAVGVVIDAQLDRSRGPVATVLVQAGTLKVGEPIVVGAVYGRVRAMYDEFGDDVESAGPSRPVALIGLSDVPKAGDLFEVVEDDRTARQISMERAEQERDESRGTGRIRLSEIYSKSQAGEVKDLNLLIKADVQGSVEALRQSIEKISSDEVRINVIHAAVGGINESDVALAAASDAIIIGFNVRPESAARRAAEREDVEMRLYRVIYEVIEEIEAAIEGLLEPTYEEVVLGRAEVRATFRVPNVGTVAGCYVTEGKILRNAEARLLRDHVVIHEGKLASLKRFKDDVREVSEGYECGIAFERYQDIKEGDIIEAFHMEEVK